MLLPALVGGSEAWMGAGSGKLNSMSCLLPSSEALILAGLVFPEHTVVSVADAFMLLVQHPEAEYKDEMTWISSMT